MASLLFLPVSPITISEGIIFGVFWGTVLSLVGSMTGATLSFLLSRYLFKNSFKKHVLQKYPKVYDIEKKLFINGFHTVFLLRLLPIFPFSLLNYILGITEVRFKDFFFASFLGMIPGTFVFVYFGDSLKMHSVIDIILSVLGILVLILLNKYLNAK